MHALRRFLQELIDERGETPAEIARRAGLSKQTLHSILHDDRPNIREMPARKTVEGLATALRVPEGRLLLAAAEAYGVPVSTPVHAPTMADFPDSELARELTRRAVSREDRAGHEGARLDLAGIDGESVLDLVELRRSLLEQAAMGEDRPYRAAALRFMASLIEDAVKAAAATDS